MELAVIRWLRSLSEAVEQHGPLSASHHRVIHPRGLPLNGPGLIRHQAIGPVARPGLPQEYMALMSFFVPSVQAASFEHLEVARGLGALITFAVNRRIDVLSELSMSMEDRPDRATFLPLSGTPDRALLAPMEIDQPRLDDLLREYLGLMVGLPEKDADVIGAALDMHYGACLLFDRDLGSSYTLLVAGIETMSRRFGTPPTDWSAWDQADVWDRFTETVGLTATQADALRTQLMKNRQLRLNETFAEYGSAALPDSFWDQEWRDWLYTIAMPDGTFTGGDWVPGKPLEQLIPRDRGLLKAALRKSYRARSGFVHAGDRIGDPTAELFLTEPGLAEGQRLSFPGLRLLLRGLIDHEIRSRSTGQGVVPELIFTLDPPPASRQPTEAAWTTPKPGARRKGGKGRRS